MLAITMEREEKTSITSLPNNPLLTNPYSPSHSFLAMNYLRLTSLASTTREFTSSPRVLSPRGFMRPDNLGEENSDSWLLSGISLTPESKELTMLSKALLDNWD